MSQIAAVAQAATPSAFIPRQVGLFDLTTGNELADPETLDASAGVTVAPGLPVQPDVGDVAGGLATSFSADFFDRVHIVRAPQLTGLETLAELAQLWQREISLGSVGFDQTVRFEIWNAFLDTPQTITSGTVTAAGVTLDPSSFPDVLGGGEAAFYSLVISSEGAGAIAGDLTFELTGLEDLVVTFTGSRIVLFPFKPERNVDEVLQYANAVIESRSGIEQRIGYRPTPRVEMRMQYRLLDDAGAWARNLLFGFDGGAYAVPQWYQATRLGVEVLAGSSVIPVDTRWTDYRDAGDSKLALLWLSPASFEVVEISVRSDAQISLLTPTATTFPPWAAIMPLRLCIPAQRFQIPRARTKLTTLEIAWTQTDSIDEDRIDAALAATNYRSAPILTDPNFIDRDLRESVIYGAEVLDGPGGPIDVNVHRNAPKALTQKTWFADGDEAKQRLRALLNRLRGRGRHFWLPTFGKDLIPTQALSAAAVALEAQQTGYADNVGQQSPRRDVIVFLRDGTTIARRIIDSSDPGTGIENFTVDSPWGVNVAIADVERISFLTRCRLDADRIVLEHGAARSMRVRVPVQEVIDE